MFLFMFFPNEALFGELQLADFELRMGEERISVHRRVLAHFSDVFRALLQQDMEEKKQGFVVVEDFSAATMRGLRRFLYTGETEEVLAEPWTFAALADKYLMWVLKDVCSWELQRKLSAANVFEWAVRADKFRLDELFGACARLREAQDRLFFAQIE